MRFLTEDELAILTIGQEAALEPFLGMVAVGANIRNRMAARSYWSDGTVEGTVLKAYQYSGWNTTMPNRIASVRLDDASSLGQQLEQAWFDSERLDPTKGSLLYFNPRVVAAPPWVASAKLVATIGRHQFYVPKKEASHAKIVRMAAHVGRFLPALRQRHDDELRRLGKRRRASADAGSRAPYCCARHAHAATAAHRRPAGSD